jgi:hypothetical protein
MKVGAFLRLLPRWPARSLLRFRVRTVRRRARLAICLFPVSLLLVLIATWSVADSVRPAATDPDYCTRRDLLRTWQAEQPDAHLIVMLGGSRTAIGFAPELLPPSTTSEGRPLLWFNFAHFGAGPVFELVILKRLLCDGVRPDVVVIEIMPSFVAREREDFLGHFLNIDEINQAASYVRPTRLGWYALKNRFAKPDQLRRAVFGPEAVPAGSLGGPTNLVDAIAPADRASRLETQHAFHDRVIRNITFSEAGDRAVRDLLDTCHAHGITPVLVLSPEGPVFQSYYNAENWSQFQNHLERLAVEKGTRLINARDWLTEEQFYDSHHPLRGGAEVFTQRLMQELRPELARLK